MNRKGSKKKFYIPALLIVFGFIFLYFLSNQSGTPIFSGFTTTALSKASFTSSSSYWTGDTYILTVSSDGMGQEAIITPEDISEAGSTKEPTSNLRLTIDNTKQQCEYAIKPSYSYDKIFQYELYTWDGGLFALGCTAAEAIKAGRCTSTVMMGYGKFGGGNECFCINEKSLVATLAVSSIENPYVHTTSRIKVASDTFSDSFNFDSKGMIQGKIGSNAYVIWNGYKIIDVCKTNSNQYFGFFNNGVWKLGQSAKYDTYQRERSARIAILETASSYSKTTLQNAITNINTYASNAVSPTSEFGTIDNSASVENAIIKQPLQSTIQPPEYTFYIKASAIGIYQPVADIKIESLSWPSFRTAGTIKANLKNYGESGTGSLSASCSGSESTSQSITVSVSKDASESYSINVKGSTDTPKTTTCVVTLTNSAGKTYTKSISTTINPESQCTPNIVRCEGNSVVKCNSAGSGENVIESCPCGCFNGGCNSCIDDGGIDDGGNQDSGTDIDWTLIIIVGAIGAVVIVLLFAIKGRGRRR